MVQMLQRPCITLPQHAAQEDEDEDEEQQGAVVPWVQWLQSAPHHGCWMEDEEGLQALLVGKLEGCDCSPSLTLMHPR